MKRFALVLGATSFVAAQTCQEVALGAAYDPYFAWLVSGTNDNRMGNVTAICASADNVARTNFDSKLQELVTACAGGAEVSTSTFGVIASLLNKVLCETKTDMGALRYCILSLLPLFDAPYLLSVANGNLQLPPLNPVAEASERQSAMCASNVCNSFIENVAPGLLSSLPATSAATIAADFIRGTVSRMRCGCVGATPCHSTAVASKLIDANGVFIEAEACDANGMPTQCARNWMACQGTAPPKCVKPCTRKTVATIKFALSNLNYDCLQNAGNPNDNIQSDVMANVPGLLKGDFSCSCAASVAPATGTTCTCEVTCGNLLALKDLDLSKEFAFLNTRASALVVPTPTLDKLLPASCKITANTNSYGSGFVLLGASLTPSEQTAGAATLGLSAFAGLAALFLAVF